MIGDLPAGTISLSLVMEDPDAPGGTWVHWVLFDLPPVGAIAGGERSLGTPGVNSWRRVGYGGPCPPSGIHRYLFRVFALDDTLRLPERSTRAEVLAAMEGHVLGEAVLMGRYGK
jgi:Raf kinase inhibitor-like YbhB/YbcL family protein